jgi:aminopeptidase N
MNYFDCSYYDVSFKAPEEYVVAASGIERESGGEHRFAAGPVRDFELQASRKYLSIERKVGSTTVTSYFFEGDSAAGGKALEAGCRALEQFSERVGPYPYTRLNICEAPLTDSGMEYSAQVVISSDMYGDPADEGDLEITVAHEVFHQWFALGVGSDAIGNAWLDESLSSFGEVLYSLREHGEKSAEEALREIAEVYTSARDDEIPDAPVEQPDSSFSGDEEYTAAVYGKGALFFNELRRRMGQSAFDRSLSEYYRGRVFYNATTEDLLAAFRANSPDPGVVDRLYRHWIKELHGDEDVPPRSGTGVQGESRG